MFGKKLIPLLIWLLAINNCRAQFGNVWPVGKMQGIDFNSSEAKLIKTGINNDSITGKRRFSECHTSAISDCNGNLLFYTNGIDIWNKKDTIMDNGRLTSSSLVNSGARNRNCIIIPIPKQINLYYVFYMINTVPNQPTHQNNKFAMALVDLSYNNGLGKVIFKDSLVHPGIIISTNLTYARHANDTDIWLIVAKDQYKMYSFKINSNGLINSPIITNVNSGLAYIGVDSDGYYYENGFIKMTSDQSKLFVTGVEADINLNGHVLRYDFNRNTGSFSNEQTIITHNEFSKQIIKSITFSPNDSLVYFSIEPDFGYSGKNFCSVLQYNSFSNKKQIVKNFAKPIGWGLGATPSGRFGMQTAPDGKTYIFLINKIYRINFPNRKGIACNIVYWDSLQYMDYANYQKTNDLNIFSLPNIYMPERKLFFNSSTDANPCTDTTTLTYQGDSTFYKLVWYFGDGDSLVQSAPNIKTGMRIKHQYELDGAYQVSLKSFHTACNAKKLYSDTILIKRNPNKITFNKLLDKKGCFSDTQSISTQFNLSNKLIAKWGDTNVDTFTTNNLQAQIYKHTYLSEKIFNRQWILMSSNGCKITWQDTVKTSFYPKPIQKITIDNFTTQNTPFTLNNKIKRIVCEPHTINIKDTATLVKEILVYWYNGDSLISTNANVKKTLVNTKNTNFTLGLNTIKTTNVFGCTKTDSFYTQIYAKPIAKFIINKDSQCLKGNNFNITNLSNYAGIKDSLNLKIQWNSTTSNSIISHSYNTSGIKPIIMNLKAEFGCTDSIKDTIYVIDHPKAQINILKNNQCLNDNLFEVNTIQNDFYKINWGDNLIKENFNNKRATHNYLKAGIYSVLVEASNAFGCIDSLIDKAVIFHHPKASFSINDSVFCLSSNKIIVNTSTNYTNIDSVKSELQFGDGWVYKQSKGNFSQNYTYKSDSVFNLKLITTSFNNCSDSIEKKVIVNPHPSFQILNKDTVCSSDTIQINVNWLPKNKIDKVLINYNNGFNELNTQLKNKQNTFFNFKPAGIGSYTFTIIAQNIEGCNARKDIDFNVLNGPIADFSSIKIDDNLNNIIFKFNDKSTNAKKWNWSFYLKGINDYSTIQNPTHNFIDTGKAIVKLSIEDNHGCKDSISKIILAYPDFKFYFPNAVSSNNDELNEDFGTNTPQFVKEYKLEVFNRWGELIFKTTDKYQKWKPELEGVYLYKVYVRDLFLKQHFYSGTVTVLN